MHCDTIQSALVLNKYHFIVQKLIILRYIEFFSTLADGSEAGITSAACRPDPAAGVGIPWIGLWNPPLTWGDTFVEVVKRIPDCPLIPGEKKSPTCYITDVHYLNKLPF